MYAIGHNYCKQYLYGPLLRYGWNRQELAKTWKRLTKLPKRTGTRACLGKDLAMTSLKHGNQDVTCYISPVTLVLKQFTRDFT